ncbi:MAG: hypothetical protein ACI8X3_003231 [Saprospiraceae bacterium]|jgi:hypothetical protein
MKKFPFLLIIVLLWSCSSFNEDIVLLDSQVPFSEIETNLPVINIVVDKSEFDEIINQVEEEIEIDGLFNLYRNHELLIEDEAIELEIKGGYSTRYPLKTLGIKFEDKYDNRDRSLINPDRVLPHHNIDKIKAIRLRNSGSDFPNTMLKDLSVTQLAINAGLDLDLTYGEAALVYINGNFYGLLNLRTEANTNGMAGLYGVRKSEITLAKITTHELIKKDGDFARIDAFVQAINQKNIDHLKKEIDLNNFIDYMVFQSYIGNTDWPHNNARFYAINEGKFRFVLFDLDKVAWLEMNKSPLKIIEDERVANVLTDLFFVLYKEETFKQAFWDRYNFLLQSGDISIEKFKPIVEANTDKIKSEIQFQINKYNAPGSMTEWNIELDKLTTLFEERETVVKDLVE